MAVSAVVVGIIKLVHHDWQHQVLWVEVLELLPFAVDGAAPTLEHWDGGVPTGAERQARAAVQSSRTTAPPPDGGAWWRQPEAPPDLGDAAPMSGTTRSVGEITSQAPSREV